MIDTVPTFDNRLAHLISLVFHPFAVFAPACIIVAGWLGLLWAVVIAILFVTPPTLLLVFLQKQQRFSYQRKTRKPLYIAGIFSALVCLAVMSRFDAPRPIWLSMVTIILFLPLQLAVNSQTKVSAHVAVITLVLTGLFFLGHINTPALLLASVMVIITVAWARMVTKSHTLLQVALGVITGLVPVLLAVALVGVG